MICCGEALNIVAGGILRKKREGGDE